MATRIQAIRAFCPRIRLLRSASPEYFMELVTRRTTLSPGVVKNVQESEIETLASLLCEGQPVRTGTVTYTPTVGLDGRISLSLRANPRLLRALKTLGAFHGEMDNSDNLGQTSDELVRQWDRTHPADPVEEDHR
jgi:hypothetical protein